MNVQKNQIYTVEITDLGADGEGIGHLQERESAGKMPARGRMGSAGALSADTPPAGPFGADSGKANSGGYTLFVKDALIGDVVRARIVKAKKGYAYARLEEILTPSPDRVEAPCPYARQCGGCQLQALSYEKQLAFKDRKVKNNLIRIGGFSTEFVERIMEAPVGMEPSDGFGAPYRYRNKAQFPVGRDRQGRLITGFYAGRTHSIIENRDCLLGVTENETVLNTVLDFAKEKGIDAYDEKTGKGLLRHVLIRKGFATGQMMVCLVLNGARLPEEEELADRLFSAVPGMTSFSVNVNRESTNVILGEKTRLIRGSERIEDQIGGLTFSISPRSFYQVNPVQTERIYAQALEYAGLTGRETVWDLYCGIGTISLFLARKAKAVYGVEIVPEAIDDAKRNAERNGIRNAHFYVGKAEEVLPEKYEKEGIFADVIVVDPPRKGCDEACLSTMVRMRPKRIVYVSCDSATLARDLKYLTGNGYEAVKGRAIDNFPGGVHVETVVLLSKGEIDSKKVRVEFSLEDMDMSGFQKGATYEQIKAYVLEKFELKVSSLYISQIKRKCGLDVGQNYNLSKKENAKVPKCPPEKEAAIMDALKYFQMIM